MIYPTLPKDRTQIAVQEFPFRLDYKTPLLFIGSCFSENIGSQLEALKFPVNINPFGTLYNPASIFRVLETIITNKQITKTDLSFSLGKYFHYLFNTTFADTEPNTLLQKINATINDSHHFFSKSNTIFITLGTSFAYRLNSNNEIVSNCHKQPDKLFTRILLDTETIKNYLEKTVELIGINKQIVFTVSPIRHLKDGLTSNQRSKAQLISTVHQIIEKYDNTFYFPAYEIMLDDLRDYRYYDTTLTHLSPAAIQYIFYHFSQSFFSENTQQIMHSVDKLNKQLRHRPLNMSKKEQMTYQEQLTATINELTNRYPFLDFSNDN